MLVAGQLLAMGAPLEKENETVTEHYIYISTNTNQYTIYNMIAIKYETNLITIQYIYIYII